MHWGGYASNILTLGEHQLLASIVCKALRPKSRTGVSKPNLKSHWSCEKSNLENVFEETEQGEDETIPVHDTLKFSWSLRHLTFSTHRSRQVPNFLHCLFSLAISNGAALIPEPKRYYCYRQRAAPTHPQQLRCKCDFACLKARSSVLFYCNRKRERHVLVFFVLPPSCGVSHF